MKSTISQITAQWEDHSTALHNAIIHATPQPKLREVPSTIEVIHQLMTILEHSSDKALIIMERANDAVDLEYALSLLDHSIPYQLILPHSDETINTNNRLIITTLAALIIGNENRSEKWLDYEILLYNSQSSIQCDYPIILKRFFGDSFHRKRLVPFIEQNILESKPLTHNLNNVKTKENIQPQRSEGKVESENTSPISLNDRKEKKESLEAINIAMLQGNFKRQYIRDQVRNERLKDVVVVTDNHQEARQLQNYLYRGRIRTKTIHNRTPENIEQQIIEEFNNNRLTVLVILDEKLEVIREKLNNVEHLYLYDLPNAYVELTDLLLKTESYLSPTEQIALATENQRAWVTDLATECPKQTININEIEGNQHRRRSSQRNNQPRNRRENDAAPRNQQQGRDPKQSQNRHQDQASTTANQANQNQQQARPNQQRSATESNRNNESRSRSNNTQETRSNNNRPNQPNRRRNNNAPNRPRQQNRQQQPRQQANDNRGNQVDNQNQNQGQGNIVNRNRLPFEANSFEANIAKINKRRGRTAFSGDPNRNFAQELQDHHQRGNNSNRQRNNTRRNNSNVDGNR